MLSLCMWGTGCMGKVCEIMKMGLIESTALQKVQPGKEYSVCEQS